MPFIKIHKPGLLSSIQDTGRFGYQQFGMPISGAMDSYSLKLANYLVGNNLSEACIEITASGPEIEFESESYIAITGADMQAKKNNKKIELNKTIHINPGDKLSFGKLKTGFRTYIAFAGGIEVPVIMGSKSTYLQGKIGGFKGRALQRNDIIKIGDCCRKIDIKKAKYNQIKVWKKNITARIIAGPESKKFTTKGLSNFLHSEFKLSTQSNRMGYRLIGEKITYKLNPEIISSGITFGSIQIPPDGIPIVLMADHQTIGGYARIANIISADFSYLAQLQPNNTIRFAETTLEKAHELLKKENMLL